MKIEIKSISIKTLLLSAFPLLVFALCLVNASLAIFTLDEYSLIEKILQVILWAIPNTVVILIASVIGAFAYNLLCSLGIRGIMFHLEEPSQVEQTEEVEETQNNL